MRGGESGMAQTNTTFLEQAKASSGGQQVLTRRFVTRRVRRHRKRRTGANARRPSRAHRPSRRARRVAPASAPVLAPARAARTARARALRRGAAEPRILERERGVKGRRHRSRRGRRGCRSRRRRGPRQPVRQEAQARARRTRCPAPGAGIGGLTKQIGKAGKQFTQGGKQIGELTDEVRAAREKAERSARSSPRWRQPAELPRVTERRAWRASDPSGRPRAVRNGSSKSKARVR